MFSAEVGVEYEVPVTEGWIVSAFGVYNGAPTDDDGGSSGGVNNETEFCDIIGMLEGILSGLILGGNGNPVVCKGSEVSGIVGTKIFLEKVDVGTACGFING